MIQVHSTEVPALGDPRRERPPDVCGYVINVPTHLNVKLPAIGRHLPKGLCKEKNSKNPRLLWKWVAGWVQVSLGIFCVENRPKTAVNQYRHFGVVYHYVFCLYIVKSC